MKLYVGNLSYDTTEHDLLAAFQPLGARKAYLNFDKVTDFSRGFGFIEFNDTTKMLAARDAMDGAELGGRTIRVNQALDKPRKEPRKERR